MANLHCSSVRDTAYFPQASSLSLKLEERSVTLIDRQEHDALPLTSCQASLIVVPA